MEAFDFEKLRAELGLGGFVRWLDADPARRAAHNAHVKQIDAAAKDAVERWLPASVWKVSRDGYGFDIKSIEVGRPLVTRAIGELLVVKRHWNTGSSPALCFGERCMHCPSERRREAYFDAILKRIRRDQEVELYRAIVSVPNAAIADLEERPIRGMKIEFYRKTARARTRVAILEESCTQELPEAIDVRRPLTRLWQLPYWPDETPAEGEQSNILKFRKQA